jgi:hypothetical protein
LYFVFPPINEMIHSPPCSRQKTCKLIMVSITFIVLVIEYPKVIVGMGKIESSAYRQGIEYIYI